MIISILILSIIGFACSLYLFIVEQKIKVDPLYKAGCDLSDGFSCSKTILSQYGNLFFISNSILGMLLYAVIGSLAILNQANLIFYISIPAILVAIYLAYISYFKIGAFCPVCTATYIIDFIILAISFFSL